MAVCVVGESLLSPSTLCVYLANIVCIVLPIISLFASMAISDDETHVVFATGNKVVDEPIEDIAFHLVFV